MNSVDVGCAVIYRNQELIIAQRKPGDSYGGYWEFPGGKKNPDETIEACLIREAQEELGILIRPVLFLSNKVHSYPTKKINLFFYLCEYVSGTPACHDCHDFRWVELKDLQRFRFLPADIELIGELSRSPDIFNRISQRKAAL